MATRFDHLALLVHDLEASARFYTTVLGLREIPNPMGGTHIRWFELGGGPRIHMQQGNLGATHLEKGTHFAIAVSDFAATLAHLTAHGVRYADMKGTTGAINTRPDGMHAVFFQDPNGYWLELNDSTG